MGVICFHSISEYRSSELPNFRVNAGTIEVVVVNKNYLVLKFCEIIPRQQLFTIILGREPNSIPFHVCILAPTSFIKFNLNSISDISR